MIPATIVEIMVLMAKVCDPYYHPTERSYARNKIIDAIPELLKAAVAKART